MKRFDVGIIGGGIIGTSAAAFLAEAGRSVVLIERDDIGAGASGRNSGVIQHPFDPVFATLFHESVRLYRELAVQDAQFAFPDAPAEFRQGMVAVMRDEQKHTLLHIRRIKAQGLTFGAEAVRGYVWKRSLGYESVLHYLSGLPLTFE